MFLFGSVWAELGSDQEGRVRNGIWTYFLRLVLVFWFQYKLSSVCGILITTKNNFDSSLIFFEKKNQGCSETLAMEVNWVSFKEFKNKCEAYNFTNTYINNSV